MPQDVPVTDSSGVPGPPERPGRYSRSANGLAGALIVTVLVVVAFVVFRGAFRDEPEIKPEPVDYLEVVRAAQDSGLTLVYPSELPDGWIATSVHFKPGDETAWGIGILTDDGRFVGVRQEDEDVADLLSQYVDEVVQQGEDVELESSVATSWETWSDDGGDLAYTSEPAALDDEVLLVYGSASAEDQEQLIGLLTTEPAPQS
jgi:hypothetical protein